MWTLNECTIPTFMQNNFVFLIKMNKILLFFIVLKSLQKVSYDRFALSPRYFYCVYKLEMCSFIYFCNCHIFCNLHYLFLKLRITSN